MPRRTLYPLAGVLAVFAVALPTAQQKGRPMAVDDLITTVRVSDPRVSPDGRTVLYVRTTTDPKDGSRNADIWAVAADGSGRPRSFIDGSKSENTPRFSPDGKRVAFISTRDGAPQVYVAASDGSSLRVVTRLAAGVQPPLVWSGDGRRIAFVSDVYPECRDEACNKRAAEEAEKNPVKMRRITRLLFRHWSEWRENVRHHIFVADVDTGQTRDVTPGDFDSPPYFYEDGAIAFSPDGNEIAFASNRDGHDVEAWSTNQDIWLAAPTGGEARRLTNGTGYDVQPVYSPDGKHLVVRSQRRAGFEADRWYLDAYDRATGARRTVFESPDISVGDFAFAPDGRSIYFTAADRGAHSLFAVGFPTGTPTRLVKGGGVAQFDPASGFAVYAKSTMAAPADVFRVDTTGAKETETQLTRENASWLDDVAFVPAESRSVSGAGGTPVQYWLLRPPDFDASRKYPVVFMIHGGPQSAWEDSWSYRWNPQLWAAQGWVVAAPNPRGSTGFGQKFVDEITQDWGGKVMTDIENVVADVARLPYVDDDRMGVAGASYGGYAVNWIIAHSDRFKAAVTHDGVFNLESMALSTEELWFPEWEFGGKATSAAALKNFEKWSPHRYVNNVKTPTLIITNELDFRVPVDQGMQMFTALRRNGVPSEMLIFPDEGHWVLKALNSRAWHQAVFGWLTKYLGGSFAS
jgi:dipeptidyl aminopeptidase/acylaminoacyl peptidase